MANNTFYLTNEGLDKMMREIQTLEKEKEYKLKNEFKIFGRTKQSDLDYINTFEELNFIRKRIAEIRNILFNARLIAPHKDISNNTVGLGAEVTIKESGKKGYLKFKLVDSLETNPAEGKISKNSPLGAALLGHKASETVFVSYPINKNYLIKNVEYN